MIVLRFTNGSKINFKASDGGEYKSAEPSPMNEAYLEQLVKTEDWQNHIDNRCAVDCEFCWEESNREAERKAMSYMQMFEWALEQIKAK